ncbi:hypothetical protein SERLA73DRAFT_24599, partial [Serpula lacrymans var. lacrymans S7.3]
MSHKWSVRAISSISKNKMDELCKIIHIHPFVISHNNLNIPFRVFSQRVDNKSHFDSGTAATVFLQPGAPPIKPLCNLQGILLLEQAAASSRYSRDLYHVLQWLITSPEFSFETYQHCNDSVFNPSAPVQRLPSGQQYITKQYMLGTVHIEEASYEGNEMLLGKWLSQLRLDSLDKQKKTGLERVIPWVGDQLTVERLRGLFRFCAQDHNSFDRLDWLVPIFGWFHLQMAFANSRHKQYLGTTAGRGLMHTF